MTYDPKRQLGAEPDAELARAAEPFWVIAGVVLAIGFGLLIWNV